MSKRILFVFAAVILAGAGIFFRASSTHTARVQADQIVKNDSAGTDTASGIATLKAFVASHMGASVSFTLKASYDRAIAAARPPAPPANTTSQVYVDAQRACSGKSDSITQARCNQNYLAQHLSAVPAATPAPVPAPKLADYQYGLVAPLWTPDLAGALLLGAVASVGVGLVMGLHRGRR